RSRPALTVRTSDIATSETINLRGLPATTIQRTLLDVSRTLPEVEALIVLDQALRKGFARLNTPLGLLAEPAESPMETRLRWLLLNAGLPRPIVQRNCTTPAAERSPEPTSTTPTPGWSSSTTAPTTATGSSTTT